MCGINFGLSLAILAKKPWWGARLTGVSRPIAPGKPRALPARRVLCRALCSEPMFGCAGSAEDGERKLALQAGVWGEGLHRRTC